MAERFPKPREGTSATLRLLIGTLLLAVFVADLASPLGLALWVFYMIPLGVCLFSRSPFFLISDNTDRRDEERYSTSIIVKAARSLERLRSGNGGEALAMLAAGANDDLAKPFEVDKLVSLRRVRLPR